MHPTRWSSNTRLAIWAALFATLTALNYAAGAIPRSRPPDPEIFFEWRTVIFELIAYGILAALALLLTAGLSRGEAFALRRPRSWRDAVGLMLQVELLWLVVSLALVAVLGTEGRELRPPVFHDPSR